MDANQDSREELMRDVGFMVRRIFANQPAILDAYAETLRLADLGQRLEARGGGVAPLIVKELMG